MNNNIFLGFEIEPNIKESSLSWKECLEKYEIDRKQSNEIMIFVEIILGPDMEPRDFITFAYHVLDFTANVTLRGIHLVIETYPWFEQFTARAISIKNNLFKEMHLPLHHFVRKDLELIIKSIQTIEKIVNQKYPYESPLFSEREEWQFYHYGTFFLLKQKQY